jgi:glycosyltransferase involved in cell wall biosynthesis
MFEQSFVRGCKLFNIDYLKVISINDIPSNTDLIWSTSKWIDPSKFPKVKFLFGPQFFVFPDNTFTKQESDSISNTCYYNCLCDWNKKIHETLLPNPRVPYTVWPFGIDTDALKPDNSTKSHVLVYYKQRSASDLDFVLNLLNKKGITYSVINYGSYKQEDYNNILKKTYMCIWVGRHESQGYAVQEAFSMNIPLLVYDVIDMKQEISNGNCTYKNVQHQLPSTAVPYWDSRCGEKTIDSSCLELLFDKMIANLKAYSPRDFILEELSDKASFIKLFKIFNIKIPYVPISLCITTMDRWSFLKETIPKYLTNPYINEIIICDENGNDAKLINNTFKDNKLKVYVNDCKLGAFLNKQRVVSLATNEYVCLMDSDNFAPVSYFEAWYSYLNYNDPDINTIYSPSKTFKQTNHPGHNFTELNGKIITKGNFKTYWRNPSCVIGLYNTGNYILSKTLMSKGEAYDLNMAVNCKALDVMYQNYLLWTNADCKFIVVPEMEYDHPLHDGSYYLQTCHSINTQLFNSLYE